jgi:hypothetical protein
MTDKPRHVSYSVHLDDDEFANGNVTLRKKQAGSIDNILNEGDVGMEPREGR